MAAEITKTNDTNKNAGCVLVPAVDIYETENEYSLKFDMPGVSKENLEITLHDNELEIRGGVARYTPTDKELKYSEFSLFDYYRKFKIGDDVDQNGIKAVLSNGVLALVLQKHEEVKPKKIEISSAAR